jgi:hypothetical protein
MGRIAAAVEGQAGLGKGRRNPELRVAEPVSLGINSLGPG